MHPLRSRFTPSKQHTQAMSEPAAKKQKGADGEPLPVDAAVAAEANVTQASPPLPSPPAPAAKATASMRDEMLGLTLIKQGAEGVRTHTHKAQ